MRHPSLSGCFYIKRSGVHTSPFLPSHWAFQSSRLSRYPSQSVGPSNVAIIIPASLFFPALSHCFLCPNVSVFRPVFPVITSHLLRAFAETSFTPSVLAVTTGTARTQHLASLQSTLALPCPFSCLFIHVFSSSISFSLIVLHQTLSRSIFFIGVILLPFMPSQRWCTHLIFICFHTFFSTHLIDVKSFI